MNNKIKFHKANGPAFATGEKWISCDGCGIECEIISVHKFGNGKWEYDITYMFEDGTTHSKDAWNFQVRYMHIADHDFVR